MREPRAPQKTQDLIMRYNLQRGVLEVKHSENLVGRILPASFWHIFPWNTVTTAASKHVCRKG